MATIVVEIYKVIPKRIKEEKKIDDLLTNPDEYVERCRRRKRTPQVTDIHELSDEIETFVDYAYKQYYFAPNRYVPKKERPKWRFIAKRFFKELVQASGSSDSETVALASELLEKLYKVLCYGCGYAIFSSDDPFRSIGISQQDFFRQLLVLKWEVEGKEDFIKNAIMLVIENGLSTETLYSDLLSIIVEMLRTTAMRELAIRQCDLLRNEIRQKLDAERVRDKKHSYGGFRHYDYAMKTKNNNIVTMALLCYASLHEYDEGIKYFQKYYMERDEEIALWVLLRWLFHFNQKEHWIRVYENAVERGITPRHQLRKVYKYIKANDELPEHFYG